jgi:hypothetical protein
MIARSGRSAIVPVERGLSSRKLSWPKGAGQFDEARRARRALSAWTMAAIPTVGYSQSVSKLTSAEARLCAAKTRPPARRYDRRRGRNNPSRA